MAWSTETFRRIKGDEISSRTSDAAGSTATTVLVQRNSGTA